MSGRLDYYSDAARALWDMPSRDLFALARSGREDAIKRAAEHTLRLKGEYVTPDAVHNEHAVIARLADGLANDPEFTIDVALSVASRGRPAAAAATPKTRRRGKVVSLWVAISVVVTLLALDVLATAGVPVPTPLGDLVDRITGPDVAPQPSAPPPSVERSGGDRLLAAKTFVGDLVPDLRDGTARAPKRVDRSDTKNTNHANGKERNFANGKESNYANGKERNFARGRDGIEPQTRGRPTHDANTPPGRRKADHDRAQGRAKRARGKP